MDRREFMLAAAGALGSPTLIGGCSNIPEPAYIHAQSDLRRPSSADLARGRTAQRELVRLATLAPSSYNSQCRKFSLDDAGVTVLPDYTRRCPVSHPDDHPLFVSLGCAAENMVQAAPALGLHAALAFDDGARALRVELSPARHASAPLFEAITRRQSTRNEYDGRAISASEAEQLVRAGTGHGVNVLLITGRVGIENALAHAIHGNTAQVNDPTFVAELKRWMRFDAIDAVRHGDGIYSAVLGGWDLPPTLGWMLAKSSLKARHSNDALARQIRSSAGWRCSSPTRTIRPTGPGSAGATSGSRCGQCAGPSVQFSSNVGWQLPTALGRATGGVPRRPQSFADCTRARRA
jgi:hypothetical protein